MAAMKGSSCNLRKPLGPKGDKQVPSEEGQERIKKTKYIKIKVSLYQMNLG